MAFKIDPETALKVWSLELFEAITAVRATPPDAFAYETRRQHVERVKDELRKLLVQETEEA